MSNQNVNSRNLIDSVNYSNPVTVNTTYKDQRITIRRDLIKEINDKVNILTGNVTSTNSSGHPIISIEEIMDHLDVSNLNLETLSSETISLVLKPEDPATFSTTVQYQANSSAGYVGLDSVTVTANVNMDEGAFNNDAEYIIDTSANSSNLAKIFSEDGLEISLEHEETLNLNNDITNTEAINATTKEFFGTKKIKLKVALENDKQVILTSSNISDTILPTAPAVGIADLTVDVITGAVSISADMLSTDATVFTLEDLTSNGLVKSGDEPVSDALGITSITLPGYMPDESVSIELLPTEIIEASNLTIINSSGAEAVFSSVIKIKANVETAILVEDIPENQTFIDKEGQSHEASVGDVVYRELLDISNPDIPLINYYIFVGANFEPSWRPYYLNENNTFSFNTAVTLGTFSNITESSNITVQKDTDSLGFNSVIVDTLGRFDYALNYTDFLCKAKSTEETFVLDFSDTKKALNKLYLPTISIGKESVDASALSSAINDPNIETIVVGPGFSQVDSEYPAKFLSEITINLPKNIETYIPNEFLIGTTEAVIMTNKNLSYEKPILNLAFSSSISFSSETLENTSSNYDKTTTLAYLENDFQTPQIDMTLQTPIAGKLTVTQNVISSGVAANVELFTFDLNNKILDLSEEVPRFTHDLGYTYNFNFKPDFKITSTYDEETEIQTYEVENFSVSKSITLIGAEESEEYTETLTEEEIYNCIENTPIELPYKDASIKAVYTDNVLQFSYDSIQIERAVNANDYVDLLESDSGVATEVQIKAAINTSNNNKVLTNLKYQDTEFKLVKNPDSNIIGTYYLQDAQGTFAGYLNWEAQTILYSSADPGISPKNYCFIEKDNKYFCFNVDPETGVTSTFVLAFDENNRLCFFDTLQSATPLYYAIKDSTTGLYSIFYSYQDPETTEYTDIDLKSSLFVEDNTLYFDLPKIIKSENN